MALQAFRDQGDKPMSRQSWKELVSNEFVATATATNTFTTAVSMLPTNQKIPFGTNFFTLGKKLKIDLNMGLSNIVTTPGTFTPSVQFGSTVVASPGAVQMTTTANTLAMLRMTIDLEVQVAGTSAQFMHSWFLSGINVCAPGATGANNAAGTGFHTAPNPPALGTAFDATTALTLDFFFGFSISNSGNGIQLRQYRVYSEN